MDHCADIRFRFVCGLLQTVWQRVWNFVNHAACSDCQPGSEGLN